MKVQSVNERTHCPYLGLRQNRAIRFAAPTAEHRCYKSGDAQEIPVDQRGYCLSVNHLSCPLYTGEWGATTSGGFASPTSLALPARGVFGRLSRRDQAFYVAVLGLITTIIFVWFGIAYLYRLSSEGGVTVPPLLDPATPTLTLVPATETASPTVTLTPSITPTTTLTPTLTPTSTATPTIMPTTTLTPTLAPTQTPIIYYFPVTVTPTPETPTTEIPTLTPEVQTPEVPPLTPEVPTPTNAPPPSEPTVAPTPQPQPTPAPQPSQSAAPTTTGATIEPVTTVTLPTESASLPTENTPAPTDVVPTTDPAATSTP